MRDRRCWHRSQIVLRIMVAVFVLNTPGMGKQQTKDGESFSLDSHHSRALRKPRFRYGSIIVTVTCFRFSRKPTENFPNEHSSFGKELCLGNVACLYHLTITAMYLLQVYLIFVKEHERHKYTPLFSSPKIETFYQTFSNFLILFIL